MLMDNEAPGATLSTNKRFLFLGRYLEYSIRAGAYASNLFFSSIITPRIEGVASSPLLKDLLVLGYGVIIYEIIWRIVNKRYRPKFQKKSEVVGQDIQNTPGLLVLDDQDYEYRVKLEKLIKQLWYYYCFQLIFSISLYGLGYASGLSLNLFLATLGLLFQFFNFMGVAAGAVASSDARSQKGSYILPIFFSMPLFAYIAYALRLFLFHG